MRTLKRALCSLFALPLIMVSGPSPAGIVAAASMSNIQFELLNLDTGARQFVELIELGGVAQGGEGWGVYNWGSGSTMNFPDSVAEHWASDRFEASASISNGASGLAFAASLKDTGLPPDSNSANRSWQICASLTSACSSPVHFVLDPHMALIVSAEASIQAQATEPWESVEVVSFMGFWGEQGAWLDNDTLASQSGNGSATRRLQIRLDNLADEAQVSQLSLFTMTQSLSLPYAVPEPHSAALVLLGLVGLRATRRRAV